MKGANKQKQRTSPSKTPPAGTIWFYRQGDLWGEFSNFYPAAFNLDGKSWPTTEHYFQAMKFHVHPEHVEAIRAASSPGEAAKMGRSRSRPLRKDWEAVKDGVMMDCLRAKFATHPDLRKILMSTGQDKLVEHTRNDSYWADGGDGRGKNMLGILLMKLREEIAATSNTTEAESGVSTEATSTETTTTTTTTTTTEATEGETATETEMTSVARDVVEDSAEAPPAEINE